MANPSYLQNFEIQQRGLDLHLYICPDIQVSPDANQEAASRPPSEEISGQLAAGDWAIYDGVDPKGNLVARAQAGLRMGASTNGTNSFNIFSIVFTDERFKGSSFKVLRTSQAAEAGEDELAIIGGTGELACAQGVATLKTIQPLQHGEIKELRIRASLPPTLLRQPKNQLMRIVPRGGNGGTPFDIEEKPRRLESVTITWGLWIDSLAFSYEDQAGERQSAGPWGGSGGLTTKTVSFSSTEIVTEVSGTTTVNGEFVKSLTFVTSAGTRTTLGNAEAEGTHFSFPVQENSSVVGLFVRAGDFIDAVGIYVHLSDTD